MSRPIATALAAALALALVSCSGDSPPREPPLKGARIGGPFALTGTDGKTVRDSDFAGKYRLVYFGYTYCPDVCPNDMQKIGQVMRTLDREDPEIAARIAPIFVSVDPERDTPAVVKEFTANFHPRITGLTGSPEAISAVAKAYAVPVQKQPPGPGGGYLVDHGTIIYLMGPDGQPIAPLTRDMDAAAMLEQVRSWVT